MPRIMEHPNSTRVFRYWSDHNQAHCDCGWDGKPRLFLWRAVRDAYKHVRTSECFIQYPLVLRNW